MTRAWIGPEKLEQAESIRVSGNRSGTKQGHGQRPGGESDCWRWPGKGAFESVIRQMELGNAVEFFDKHVREHALHGSERVHNLAKTAQRAIDNNSGDFEAHFDDLRGRTS